jgi:MFS transporter, DHA2 family, methylenomycin A resistance protein
MLDKVSALSKALNAPSRPPSTAKLGRALTLAAMSLGYGVVQLDVTIVNTALQAIGASLGGGVSSLQWVVTTYTIAFAAFILTAGALGDRVGAKKVFMAGFAIFTLASLACALAPTTGVLIAARAVQGLGAAILVPNSLALLNHAYPEEKQRSWAVGIYLAGASLALTAGPFAGGALASFAGWRSIFLVNLPLGAAGLWLTWRYATETPAAKNRELDLPGQVLAITALGFLAAAIIEAGAVGLRNAWIVAAFAVFTVASVLFVVREARSGQPMLPLSLFTHRMFSLMAAIGLLVNIAFYGLIFVLSLYFQKVEGWSAFEAGLAFVPMMAIVLPANLVAARVSDRLGARGAIAAGAAISAIGCAALFGLSRETSYPALAVQLLAIGAGLGLLVPPLTSALLGSVEKPRSGIAAGVLNATRQTGSVIGVALFGSLIARPDMFMTGMREALIICVVLLAGSAAAVLAPFRRSSN